MIDIAKLEELARAAKDGLVETIYPGYFVDCDGSVWSKSNWRGYGLRKLSQHPNSHGYPSVKVKFEGRMKKALVHVMVCRAFHGIKPSDIHQVRHLNGVKSDCRSLNLSWGTPKENAADRKSHGTERAAQNGKNSAYKLIGSGSDICKRGHNKDGRPYCNQCRNNRRAQKRGNT